MTDYCRQAVRVGIQEIVFTEHFDLNPLEPGRWYLNYQRYSAQVEECRRRYHGLVTVKMGLELGEPHLYRKEIEEYIRGKNFDFLLGSVHWVDDLALHREYCDSFEARKAYLRYFSEVYKAVEAGGFQVLGHLDLLKRYAPPDYRGFSAAVYREAIWEILRRAVGQGIGLEINTSGIRQKLKETLPSAEILRWYRELGGDILTFGSDAHRVRDLGADIPVAHQLAARCGFRQFTTFSRGEPTMHPL
ncbi:hypothetical protein SY88_19065 [Clostridiales bacterium PH28_bin88]|nr:hypothetical protein SY88_19065 [Clostridiales bacterium PH28_bin88]